MPTLVITVRLTFSFPPCLLSLFALVLSLTHLSLCVSISHFCCCCTDGGKMIQQLAGIDTMGGLVVTQDGAPLHLLRC